MARMVKCNANGVVGDLSTFYKINNKWYQVNELYSSKSGNYRFEQTSVFWRINT